MIIFAVQRQAVRPDKPLPGTISAPVFHRHIVKSNGGSQRITIHDLHRMRIQSVLLIADDTVGTKQMKGRHFVRSCPLIRDFVPSSPMSPKQAFFRQKCFCHKKPYSSFTRHSSRIMVVHQMNIEKLSQKKHKHFRHESNYEND